MDYLLTDLIDTTRLQRLLESLHKVTGYPVALLDQEGVLANCDRHLMRGASQIIGKQ